MIVHVLGRMSAGGNERLCLELIRRAPAVVSQTLISIDATPHGPLEDLFRSIPNLHFFHVPHVRTERTRFILRLALLLRDLKTRGVIVYPFGLHLLVALACKALPACRFIAHVGNPPPSSGPVRTMFRRIVIGSRWLDAPLWSCSQTVHDQLSDLGARMPRGSRGVPNGINIEALRVAAARGKALRSKPGPVVAMMARLDAIKDHATLLDAFARVVRQRPNAKLWLVGDGIRRQVLERQTATLGIADAVSFLGVRQDVGELLGQTDVFVFSTTAAEGFGIAIAEAMALGLPIVATDVPACHEVLDGGKCGLLVPPKDDAALAAGILSLLDDPERGRRLGDAAAVRARQEYDITKCAAEYFGYLLDDARV